jgi:hypothetical protein
VTWTTATGIRAGATLQLAWTLSTLELPMNKIELLLDRGFVDVCISALKAFELQGAGKVGEANVQGLWCCVSLLSTLDLTAPEAAPIVQMLEDMPSTLRFILVRDLRGPVSCLLASHGP